MATAGTINFSAFKGDTQETRLAKLAEATSKGQVVKCGWIPRDELTSAQKKIHDTQQEELPRFTLRGRFAADQRRYALWKAGIAVTGKFLLYNWQQTGSCVGAGGGNMTKTGMCVEIALKGELEQYKELWWPYTYGRSRFHSGIGGTGEGSTGSGYAKAATEDGFFEIDAPGLPDMPDFKVQDGWLVQPGSVEMQWSNGAKIGEQYLKVGRTHLFKTAAKMRSADDCYEAIANGYCLTQASDFGFRNMVPRVYGTKFPVRIASWDGKWSHQTFIDEVWDHPEVNDILFHWGNNWGPTAHGTPTGDEPPGGVYIRKATMDQICRTGEVYAFSMFDGFPARELNFSAF